MRARTIVLGLLVAGCAGGCASPEQSTEQQRIDDDFDFAHASTGEPDMKGVVTLDDMSGSVHDMSGAVHDMASVHDMAHPIVHDMAQPIVHDMAMPLCNPSSVTIGANGGQDICPYGDYCEVSPVQCIAATVGSCAAGSGAPVWDTASKLAPVITSATVTGLATTSSTTECAGGDPAALVTINYYAATPLSTSLTTLESEVRWKKSTLSTGTWYGGTFVRELPTAGAHVGQIQIGMNCGASSGTLAVYLQDAGGHTSNVVCVTW